MNGAQEEVRALKRVRHLVRTGQLPELRDDVGLSQTAVAKAIGVHPSQVSRWESDKARPRPRHAVALLELLDGDE